ncbi:hypothetical protein FA15DRAFT_102296 [Coprinopsis marcescibilis]|uniref:Uncharacterized protein n=1 Tax=Coprinopsis marcescibilis TaxID=230819 RepID=A0A5C3KYB9_COPMA|nr:hypothetical protein FA15DRAFT_102296 [Coprinopsis marcescibilis]
MHDRMAFFWTTRCSLPRVTRACMGGRPYPRYLGFMLLLTTFLSFRFYSYPTIHRPFVLHRRRRLFYCRYIIHKPSITFVRFFLLLLVVLLGVCVRLVLVFFFFLCAVASYITWLVCLSDIFFSFIFFVFFLCLGFELNHISILQLFWCFAVGLGRFVRVWEAGGCSCWRL